MWTPIPFHFLRAFREEYRERVILRVMGMGLTITENPKWLIVRSLIRLREGSPSQITLTFPLGNPGKPGGGAGLRCPSEWAFEWSPARTSHMQESPGAGRVEWVHRSPVSGLRKSQAWIPSSLIYISLTLPSLSCLICKMGLLWGLNEITCIKCFPLCLAYNKLSIEWWLWHLHSSLSHLYLKVAFQKAFSGSGRVVLRKPYPFFSRVNLLLTLATKAMLWHPPLCLLQATSPCASHDKPKSDPAGKLGKM